MGVTLTRGGNVSLAQQSPGLTAVRVGLSWTAGEAYDLDASALLCGGSGRVLSDEHFVFFNNPRSPDGSVRHRGTQAGAHCEEIDVDLASVPADVEKIVFPLSLYEAARRGQDFGGLTGARIRLTDREAGTEIVKFVLPDRSSGETAMLLGELYRRGAEWKFRAVGQGYASGLAGIANDFGVDVLREPEAPESVPAPPTQPAPPPAPVAPPPLHEAAAMSQQPLGSPSMTCFFDPGHGPGSTPVTWSPQWGVPRGIGACAACAQRVQTTPPPYYTAPQAGYPQGYPQQQDLQQPGQPDRQGGRQRRFGMGAMVGAGAAGLMGGALLNEAFSDDEPDVTVNQYFEGDEFE